MQSGSIVREYLSNDIARKCPNLPSFLQDHLVEMTDKYFRREISYEQLMSEYEKYSADTSTPETIRRVLSIDSIPIRPSFNPFPKECVAGRRNRSIPWTEAEDARLIAAIFSMGAKDWRRIAEFVGNGRSSSQCNQRWCRALDPSILHNPWTQDEDTKLLNAVNIIGNKSWCQIAKVIKGRTDLQCRYRFHQLTRYRKATESDPPDDPPDDTPPEEFADCKPNTTVSPFINNIAINVPSKPNNNPTIEMPYFLESSFLPRNDNNGDYLHRLTPTILKRK